MKPQPSAGIAWFLAASFSLSGCFAPAGSAVVAGSAAAGASSAAMNGDHDTDFGSRPIATQTLLNPALSAAPGAVLGGAALGSAAGASVQASHRLDDLDRDHHRQPVGELRLADLAGAPPGPAGDLSFAAPQPTGQLLFHGPPPPLADLPDHPWVATTPIGIYVNHVLDDTFIDEERRPWRAEMARRFAPVVAGCATRREAILKVARSCAGVCGVEYSTQRRRANQCVAESLETGTASCTGLSILLAAAYRSVGIPARLVQVAQWSDRPGNHTWVEVWDADGWHFVEYYPDKTGLDHGWMLEPCSVLNPANPASRVVARAPGRPGASAYRLPWNPDSPGLGGEDRTAFYRQRARELGIAGGSTKPDQLVIIGALAPETRTRRPFRVLDAAGAEIARGMTPDRTDDANDAPRVRIRSGEPVTVEITQPDGSHRRRTLIPARGDTPVR